MSLRIGFDLDGVLADLASAYREVETRLFGASEVEAAAPESPEPQSSEEDDEETDRAAELNAMHRKHEAVWRAIQDTDNFWTTLKPIDTDAVRRISDLTRRHRWQVSFITQRPETRGQSVQRQTQRWLVKQGLDLPSVIVLAGSRGKAAAALELDYLVDDTAKNCVDAKADSPATKCILVQRQRNLPTERSARGLGIAVVKTAGEALDLLEEAQEARDNPTLWEKLAKRVRWK